MYSQCNPKADLGFQKNEKSNKTETKCKIAQQRTPPQKNKKNKNNRPTEQNLRFIILQECQVKQQILCTKSSISKPVSSGAQGEGSLIELSPSPGAGIFFL